VNIEAMKQALEALDSKHDMSKAEWRVLQYRAFNALRAAIAEASGQDVQQEMDCYGDGNVYRGQRSADSQIQTILVPPRREWVELTDEEINSLDLPESGTATIRDFVRIIEAKLKEKNDDK